MVEVTGCGKEFLLPADFGSVSLLQSTSRHSAVAVCSCQGEGSCYCESEDKLKVYS